MQRLRMLYRARIGSGRRQSVSTSPVPAQAIEESGHRTEQRASGAGDEDAQHGSLVGAGREYHRTEKARDKADGAETSSTIQLGTYVPKNTVKTSATRIGRFIGSV